MIKENSKKISFLKISVFNEFSRDGFLNFEKGKRGPNEPKVTLVTIGTTFLACRLNVAINERNIMFGKKNIKKY